ncbi:NAD-dependent epimerase/dehydratase family protein [Carboxylicivirga linearis]|uniref:NAD-dependent epimerase/dehydratase family protein n=1 Tax=Carboxylicivirga linearis TaxID=1628157 RepID=A0ABS5JTL2_9BACT|nr:NAD-dependent epimerase/dehydratase family protein [Carboxylicivirga linearis]MBS2098220.1 NAD-dependent epimerase/dehydratase family protein [Carboxylicivirga linearis]
MIFITGGTGLVGSHLLYNLTKEGKKVRALCRDTSSKEYVEKVFRFYSDEATKLFSNIEWFEGDLHDYFSLLDALNEVDHVYHCAAMVSFKPSDAKEMFSNNVDGTANLVNACIEKKVNRFCFVSSIATLGGSINGTPIDETTFWQNDDNHSVYSQSKFQSEMEVWRGTKEGLNAIIVNPSVIIGPVELDRSTGQLFKTMMKGTPFFTNGSTGFVDVRDVAAAMINLCNSNIANERFIINGENLLYKDFFTLGAKEFKVKPPRFRAGRILTGIAWRMERLKYYLFRTEPHFTKETARTSQHRSVYSDEKYQKLFPTSRISIGEAILNTANYLRK